MFSLESLTMPSSILGTSGAAGSPFCLARSGESWVTKCVFCRGLGTSRVCAWPGWYTGVDGALVSCSFIRLSSCSRSCFWESTSWSDFSISKSFSWVIWDSVWTFCASSSRCDSSSSFCFCASSTSFFISSSFFSSFSSSFCSLASVSFSSCETVLGKLCGTERWSELGSLISMEGSENLNPSFFFSSPKASSFWSFVSSEAWISSGFSSIASFSSLTSFFASGSFFSTGSIGSSIDWGIIRVVASTEGSGSEACEATEVRKSSSVLSDALWDLWAVWFR